MDLLPDREAATVASWRAECPGTEVVCRDRAPFFAEGVSTGAPTAVQVADRFHLWRNLGEAAERCVSRHRYADTSTMTKLYCPVHPHAATAKGGRGWQGVSAGWWGVTVPGRWRCGSSRRWCGR
ncbi:transposase [Streptomyces sp. NPDC048258]|uniref:transposase n=1 Tax=Streptomyces sp. NPDC048258 TaxID=3365527 RepID=UPI0037168DE1